VERVEQIVTETFEMITCKRIEEIKSAGTRITGNTLEDLCLTQILEVGTV